MLASRMVSAEPRRLPLAIFLMKRGTSMCVGQAAVHGASKQNRQRLASASADCESSAGCRSGNCSRFRSSGWTALLIAHRPRHASPHAARLLSSSPMNWSTSLRPMFMGGEMRSTLPYMPPLPISSPILARGFHHMRGLRRGGRLGLAVFHQFDGLQQAHAAHVADQSDASPANPPGCRADSRRSRCSSPAGSALR